MTVQKLLNINDRFYQSFGAAFAETRRRIQPGVQRIVEHYISGGDWLDIGCGSGALSQRLLQCGLSGSYLGLDFSPALLAEAQLVKEEAGVGFTLNYQRANLLDESWTDQAVGKCFDGVLAFAVLHHLPGAENRRRIIQQAAGLVKPGGYFIHSEWQFQNSAKLMARVQPWSAAGLTQAEVEAGDTLLDWRHQAAGQDGENGLRYVHLFSQQELDELFCGAGLTKVEEFLSDGQGGNLGLYQVWQKLGQAI